jgi:hypothetical protein
MKNHSGGYGKKRETLPLEGGGKRVGVERGADGHSKKAQETLYGHRGAFVEVSEKQADRRFQV